MRISDWSSDVCSSDLTYRNDGALAGVPDERNFFGIDKSCFGLTPIAAEVWDGWIFVNLQPEPEVGLAEFLGDFGESYCGIPYVNAEKRSEEHTSELQSLMRISYAVFCLKTNMIYPHEKKTERI